MTSVHPTLSFLAGYPLIAGTQRDFTHSDINTQAHAYCTHTHTHTETFTQTYRNKPHMHTHTHCKQTHVDTLAQKHSAFTQTHSLCGQLS